MSNTPDNPPPSNPPPDDPKGPWSYSGGAPSPSNYNPPTPQPHLPANEPVAPAPDAATPAPLSTPMPAARDATPPAAAPRHRSSQKPPEPDHSMAHVIDTIEAIIIALIIALTFRAFIVEAFVIPTGSMAPTLLGAHYKAICPQCGFQFDRETFLGLQLVSRGQVGRYPHGELISNRGVPWPLDNGLTQLHCPNCGFGFMPSAMPQYLSTTKLVLGGENNSKPENVSFVWANNGDRILVLKYFYALFQPHRWDVIVFKEPMAARDNYIKRLIGLPGETIEIINGDIFVAPPGKSERADRVIARKPPEVQQALWQPVYDNDFYPKDEHRPRKDPWPNHTDMPWENPWKPGGPSADKWNLGPNKIAGPILTYQEAAPGRIDFTVRDESDPYTYNIIGYNDDLNDAQRPCERVADLRLETTWTPANAQAASIQLMVGQAWASRFWNQYRVSWSSRGVELEERVDANHFNKILSLPPIYVPEAGHAYKLAFENVDHVQRFYVDGRLLLERESPYNAEQAASESASVPRYKEPQPATVPASIEVTGACTLGHLKLFHDLYYTQTNLNALSDPSPRAGYLSTLPGTAVLGHPLTLHNDEFFAMGDNSRRSHDGRSWAVVYPALDDLGTRPGVVPRRYLLGKAFFVYWPAGYSPMMRSSLPFLPDLPLIPNVGNMRMIR